MELSIHIIIITIIIITVKVEFKSVIIISKLIRAKLKFIKAATMLMKLNWLMLFF